MCLRPAACSSPSGGTITITGWFGPYDGATLTFRNAPYQTELVRQGVGDSFVTSFTGDGHLRLRWAKRAGGRAATTEAARIGRFADGSTLVTGGFSGDATFGSGESAMTTLSALGNADPFFARFGP